MGNAVFASSSLPFPPDCLLEGGTYHMTEPRPAQMGRETRLKLKLGGGEGRGARGEEGRGRGGGGRRLRGHRMTKRGGPAVPAYGIRCRTVRSRGTCLPSPSFPPDDGIAIPGPPSALCALPPLRSQALPSSPVVTIPRIESTKVQEDDEEEWKPCLESSSSPSLSPLAFTHLLSLPSPY